MSEIMEALQSKIRASRIKTEELNAQRAKTKEDIEKCHEVKELSRVQRRMEIEEEAGGIKKEDAGMKEGSTSIVIAVGGDHDDAKEDNNMVLEMNYLNQE